MNKGRIQHVIDTMDPFEAVDEIAAAAKKLFSLLGEDSYRNFLMRLSGDEGQDKIAGLVHL
jgi:hypothetical protein